MLRQTTLCAVLASAAIGVALFALKYQVRDLESELTSVNRQIIANREAIHVLHAEWTYLNNPDRLASLASRLLQLQPVTPDHIGTIASLPLTADVEAAALAAAAPPPPATRKSPAPQGARGPVIAQNPAIAQNNDGTEPFARRIMDALTEGQSPR